MNLKLDFTVAYLAVFLLNSAFCREPSSDITKEVQKMAEACCNPEVGNEVIRCLSQPESNITTKGSSEAAIFFEDLKILPNCIQPLKQLVSTCGKDNCVTMLEIVRAIGQNDGKLIKKLEEVMSKTPKGLRCLDEEETKIMQTLQICYKEKELEDYLRFGAIGFCGYATGARSCFQEAHGSASPEDCPRYVAMFSVLLEIFDTTEIVAEDSAAVHRCFNTSINFTHGVYL